jgi:hypothetical protein
MDSYRSVLYTVSPSSSPQKVTAKLAQRSQRYQKIILLTPYSSILFSRVGFQRIRPDADIKCDFRCSNETLNRIWRDGVRTVDLCTVARNETTPAWEVTVNGTRVYGGHWAPCRHGTRWGDKVVRFDMQIEEGGASWGINMVANGLIFCLDAEKRTVSAFEGLSNQSSVFPAFEKGSWVLSEEILLDQRLRVETRSTSNAVELHINGQEVGKIHDLEIHPILGGDLNTGSIAFGGLPGWITTYRSLQVTDLGGELLYENSLAVADWDRTLADFQVGTNQHACTIDGAKRDRACFGGDLHVMGRAVAYSTMDFDAVAGSIKLLTSHHTKDGYLGNLCPIQAPLHDSNEEPPTYAFYSLTYALLLIVAIKDYWLHSGDDSLVNEKYERLRQLMLFTSRFITDLGLIEAPPSLSSWFIPTHVK